MSHIHEWADRANSEGRHEYKCRAGEGVRGIQPRSRSPTDPHRGTPTPRVLPVTRANPQGDCHIRHTSTGSRSHRNLDQSTTSRPPGGRHGNGSHTEAGSAGTPTGPYPGNLMGEIRTSRSGKSGRWRTRSANGGLTDVKPTADTAEISVCHPVYDFLGPIRARRASESPVEAERVPSDQDGALGPIRGLWGARMGPAGQSRGEHSRDSGAGGPTPPSAAWVARHDSVGGDRRGWGSCSGKFMSLAPTKGKGRSRWTGGCGGSGSRATSDPRLLPI
jgi:hypothetical protein